MIKVALFAVLILSFALGDVVPSEADATGQFDMLEKDRMAALSNIAYSPVEIKDVDPMVSVVRARQRMMARTSRFLRRSDVSDEDRKRGQHVLNYLQSLRVEDATRDGVAVSRTDNSGQKRLEFGFRGTAELRDLIPDAQLALNSKKIRRLDEARAFVKRVRDRNPNVNDQNVVMTGHSLGGFIAEGVSNDYRGQTRTVTFSSGAPILRRGSGIARAFSQNTRIMPATRFTRKGDLVPKGIKNLNYAAQTIVRPSSYKGLFGFGKEHSLNNEMPWLSSGRSQAEIRDIKRRWAERKWRNRGRAVTGAFKNAGRSVERGLRNVGSSVSNGFNAFRRWGGRLFGGRSSSQQSQSQRRPAQRRPAQRQRRTRTEQERQAIIARWRSRRQ